MEIGHKRRVAGRKRKHVFPRPTDLHEPDCIFKRGKVVNGRARETAAYGDGLSDRHRVGCSPVGYQVPRSVLAQPERVHNATSNSGRASERVGRLTVDSASNALRRSVSVRLSDSPVARLSIALRAIRPNLLATASSEVESVSTVVRATVVDRAAIMATESASVAVRDVVTVRAIDSARIGLSEQDRSAASTRLALSLVDKLSDAGTLDKGELGGNDRLRSAENVSGCA